MIPEEEEEVEQEEEGQEEVEEEKEEENNTDNTYQDDTDDYLEIKNIMEKKPELNKEVKEIKRDSKSQSRNDDYDKVDKLVKDMFEIKLEDTNDLVFNKKPRKSQFALDSGSNVKKLKNEQLRLRTRQEGK
jgi:hypothetical protein